MRPLSRLFPLLACLALAGCSGLFFYPDPELQLTPDRAGLAYRDVRFKSADGLELHGWFLPADPAAAKGSVCTMLFVHGNAENISTHIAAVWWLPPRGVNVFMFDYRGYGLSEGEPSIEGVHIDAEAALSTMLKMPEVDAGRTVVFGQSMGGAVAITTVARSKHRTRLRALIVEGAFSGFRSIVRDKMASAWLTWPLQWIPTLTISDDHNPLDSIGRLSPLPVLLVHGAGDRVISPDNARALYEAAREPKELWMIPDAKHIAAFRIEENRAHLLNYLRKRGCMAE
jgi:fermentation-respiration switch protein FrsA (DUF1100 family)